MKENQETKKLNLDDMEHVSGGLEGNLDIPEGYKRVCDHCGSDRVSYWIGMGAPVCKEC